MPKPTKESTYISLILVVISPSKLVTHKAVHSLFFHYSLSDTISVNLCCISEVFLIISSPISVMYHILSLKRFTKAVQCSYFSPVLQNRFIFYGFNLYMKTCGTIFKVSSIKQSSLASVSLIYNTCAIFLDTHIFISYFFLFNKVPPSIKYPVYLDILEILFTTAPSIQYVFILSKVSVPEHIYCQLFMADDEL